MVIRSAVPLRIAAAVEDATGEVVDVDARVGWLLELVHQMSVELMQSCWRPETFAALHAGVDALGRKLPSTGAGVAARLGWVAAPPAGPPTRALRAAALRRRALSACRPAPPRAWTPRAAGPVPPGGASVAR